MTQTLTVTITDDNSRVLAETTISVTELLDIAEMDDDPFGSGDFGN